MTTVDDPRLAYVALSCLIEPGHQGLGDRVIEHGPVETLSRLFAGELPPSLSDTAAARLPSRDPIGIAEAAIERADRLGVRLVTPVDEDWPGQVRDLVRISNPHGDRIDRDTYPPLCLWVRGPGALDEVLDRSVAVVGARASTAYGEHATIELAYQLAERGWTVVSGGAYGIDAAAHRGALSAGGLTVAVLACGVDRPYPVSNTSLFERIPEDGLLVSEWPPGAEPHRQRFLIRNRVIAAVTRGTVMMEAAARSGASQTLHRARALGRRAMALPGPVTSAMSVGCHAALREEGVRLVTNAGEVMEEVGSIGTDLAPAVRGPEFDHDMLDQTTACVLDGVPRRGRASAEEVAARAGVSVREAIRSLGLLVMHGFVTDVAGRYALAKPS